MKTKPAGYTYRETYTYSTGSISPKNIVDLLACKNYYCDVLIVIFYPSFLLYLLTRIPL